MFKTFPKFSKLTLADREEYGALIKDYPPFSEFAFTTLMSWWNALGSMKIAKLNGNAVLSYWLPGDEVNSGLSLVGTKKVDESICEILDFLKEKQQQPRLVHVPEFVINRIRYAELFTFIGERDFDEYIIPVRALYPLGEATSTMRIKIRRFLNSYAEDITVNSLDLGRTEDRRLLLECSREWWRASGYYKSPKLVEEAMESVVENARHFGIQNICTFIRGKFCGFYLYELMQDGKLALANYTGFDPSYRGGYEFIGYKCFERLAELGVDQVNLDFDLGSHFFRTFQLKLGPSNYFRKYTLEIHDT
jgi:hypothetical protein